MATNDFLVFGGGSGANVITQVTYSGLAARTAGFAAGVAQSAQLNKVWRQSSIMAAVLAQFISDQTGQDALDDGTTATLLANLKAAVKLSHGQCRLSVVSGTQLKLSPYNGNGLIINGLPQQIPAAGVTIANTGLAASTLYYVYAYMNAGAMALELSTTGHSTGSTGIEQKTGDATRTLVGMIYTSSATPGLFVDSVTQRWCANWFWRRTRGCVASLVSDVTFTTTTLAEITASFRVSFLYWADDDGAPISFSGTMSCNTSGAQISAAYYADGALGGNIAKASISGGVIANVSMVSQSIATNSAPFSEGVHTIQAYGAVTAGTGTMVASSVLTASPKI